MEPKILGSARLGDDMMSNNIFSLCRKESIIIIISVDKETDGAMAKIKLFA
jgi:hypothetical protein